MFISKMEPINKPLKFILDKFKNALYDSDITPLPDEKEFRDVLKRYLKEKEELDKKKMEIKKEEDDGYQTPRDKIIDDFVIKFKTTLKNSKEYKYREHIWDLSKQLDLETFLRETKHSFEYGGCIESRTDEENKDKYKKVGYNIKGVDKFKDKTQLIYLMTVTNNGIEKIIKGGKVKGKLSDRSYTAGTEYNWTITGQASSTNYIYSQIFRKCLEDNILIKFYVCHIPSIEVPYQTSSGNKKYAIISPYEEVEKDLNLHLKTILGRNLIGEGNLEELNKS